MQNGRRFKVFARSGRSRQHENSGANDRADTESSQRPRSQSLAKTMLRPVGLGDQLVDGFAAEKLVRASVPSGWLGSGCFCQRCASCPIRWPGGHGLSRAETAQPPTAALAARLGAKAKVSCRIAARLKSCPPVPVLTASLVRAQAFSLCFS